jgi:G3E family GTPase
MRVAVVVNDFGSIDIDSQLITNVQSDVISLANGCVCCTMQSNMVDTTVLRFILEGILKTINPG